MNELDEYLHGQRRVVSNDTVIHVRLPPVLVESVESVLGRAAQRLVESPAPEAQRLGYEVFQCLLDLVAECARDKKRREFPAIHSNEDESERGS